MSSFASQNTDSLLVASALTSEQIAPEIEYFKKTSMKILSVKVKKINNLDKIIIVSENGYKDGAEVYFRCKNSILTITRSLISSQVGSNQYAFKAEMKGDQCDK
jgi:hypothetical protein